MKNGLDDLQNHLFAQLERLGDEDLKGDDLSEEINRAKAISDIATQVIANSNLVLKAMTFTKEYGIGGNESKKMPTMLKELFLKE
ncbi:hypothetical protein [Candidatus Formimonas warabiya]|uniref:Phage protein n=1 Tax=Formimonas warabiya TaxID=1761012 RepID=A0A3G1KNU8_FORW1|nr:hypothetical protein [Candidatus Formimonas warabiya]ATW24138.1 hypothetical protein DCMF_04490 [Candidatus Formimonas warabiya]